MTSLADRVNRFIVEGAKLLKLDSEPIEGMHEQTLINCYNVLIGNADLYLEFSEDEKIIVARTNREALNMNDFQATHYILRQNLPIEVIDRLSKQECRKVGLDLLYAHPRKYKFFKPREKALQRFHEVGIIQDLSDYCRKREDSS